MREYYSEQPIQSRDNCGRDLVGLFVGASLAGAQRESARRLGATIIATTEPG